MESQTTKSAETTIDIETMPANLKDNFVRDTARAFRDFVATPNAREKLESKKKELRSTGRLLL